MIANAGRDQLVPHVLEISHQPRFMLYRGDSRRGADSEYRDDPVLDSGTVNFFHHVFRDIRDVTVAGCLQAECSALDHGSHPRQFMSVSSRIDGFPDLTHKAFCIGGDEGPDYLPLSLRQFSQVLADAHS